MEATTRRQRTLCRRSARPPLLRIDLLQRSRRHDSRDRDPRPRLRDGRRRQTTSNCDGPNRAPWYWGVGAGKPGTLITYFERPHERRMRMGAGQTHHFALAVQDDDSQLQWREKIVKAGIQVTEVLDRVY